MAISDSSLSQNVWSDVRSALVAASIITSVGSSSTSPNITASFPDKPSIGKPIIVIRPIQSDEDSFKFGGTEGLKTINVVMECYAGKPEEIDQMSDAIRVALKANTIAGIDLIGLSEDYAFTSPGENKYHLKTVVASYQRE